MTEPRRVGGVAVEVSPDATDWSEKLRAQILPGSDRIGSEIGDAIGSAMYRQVEQSIIAIRARLDELGLKQVDVRVNLNDRGQIAGTAAEIGLIGIAADGSGGGVNVLGGRLVALGAAAILGADIAIPAILAIGTAAAAAFAGIAVLAGGFHGVFEAVSAAGKQAGGGGGGGANDAIQAQQRQLSATQATRSANDRLTEATRTQTAAERDLHDARVQAARDLIDLDNKLRDNALNQEQAAINLAEAKRTLAQTLAAPGANLPQYANDVAQARLNVATAQQQVVELKSEGQRLAVDDAKAHKAGVEGSDNVLQARQRLIDANHKLAEAQLNVTETALRNQLAEESAAASMAAGAAGANQFADAMAKLNPLQREFVNFLLTLRPLMADLGLAASAFLPGLQAGIQAALPAFPQILEVVHAIATAFGTVFENIGKQFVTPEGREFLIFLTTELPKQIVFLGDLFIRFGRLFASIWEAASPLIEAFEDALLGMLDSANEAARDGGLKAFFDSLIPLIPPTMRALSAFGRLFGEIFEALAPALGPILDVVALLANELADLAEPVLRPLAIAFGDFLTAVSPLIPILGDLAAAILPPLIQALDLIINQGVLPLAAAIAESLAPVIPPLAEVITGLVQALAPVIVQILQQLVPVMPVFAKLFIDILNAVLPLIPPLGDLLAALVPLVAPTVQLAAPMLKLADTILPPLISLLGPLIKLMQLLEPALRLANVPLKIMADTMQQISDLIGDIPGIGAIGQGIDVLSPKESIGGGLTLPPPKHRAGGGSVTAGDPYAVGEWGPNWELFVPEVSGAILNQSQLANIGKAFGNGRQQSNYFSIFGANDPVATSHAVASRLAARAV